MNKITFPLKQVMQGAVVTDLQDALQLCLDRRVLLAADDAARREMSEALARERIGQTYRDATAKLVSLFQDARSLPANGEVDEPTAKALNDLLQQLGMFDVPSATAVHVVSGEVRREDGLPAQGVRMRAFHETEHGAILLGENVTDAQGRYTIRYEVLPGVGGTNLRVSAEGDDGALLQSSDATRNAKPLEIIDLTLPVDRKPAGQRWIEGQVMLQHGLPAAHLKLRLFRLDFGGKATLLNETTTLASGRYAFQYDSDGKAASLQVRVVNVAGEEIPLSQPLNDRSGESRTRLNLVAPGTLQPQAAEYRRLAGDLTAQIGAMTKLADARENSDRQDLTVLNRATGWDARLIALAATTERLSADADVQLPQEVVYGLLRAGLPSSKLTLAQVEPDAAEQALKAVRAAGIVELSDAQIAEFKTKFSTFATKVRLNIPAPGSGATYGQLLGASGLSPEVQAKFAPVYLGHRGNGAQLWEEAREAGLNDPQIRKLQLQGKLAFLAGNSEGMTARLMLKGIDDPAQLVEQNFYRADAWVNDVLAHAGIPLTRRDNLTEADKKKLDAEVPTRYAGEKVEDRLHAYARDMARKVSRSYPTQVIGRLIEQDAIKLPASRDQTVALLKNAAGQGFRLGQTPVEGFLRTHKGVRAGVTDADFQSAQDQVKTLQRVYQITPSNEAMPVLLGLKMTSAYDVMAYPEAEFTALYEDKYIELYGKHPVPTEPRLVYRKARQVSSVTYNVFAIAGKLDSAPPVAGMSAPAAVRESVRDGLIKQFPTMESLFGSMDFCECEHCRSVLSPAAYLVDMLQFVDPEAREWENFLSRWKTTHGGQDYPHPKPYDVLMERRPDLPHIALTCENTHTALPYIDIVNEILEYYVANGKLEEGAARDTGEATTAELLAEPQNVTREAYDQLRKARYPLTLPFDLWTETVRQFCDHFETSLAHVMEVLRPTDELFAPTQPFDRFTVFMESLGLSPAELAIFIDPDPLAKWHELYGFSTPQEATTDAFDTTGARLDLNSAKTLARRLGVTYKEITEIVQTAFVNPAIAKLGVLYKLGVSIEEARSYLDHKALLPQDPAALSAGDRKLRLEAQAFEEKLAQAQLADADIQAIPFAAVLVLADASAGGNFDLTTLRYADGDAADPIAYLRINLFVRLWRKLGWSIEETGRALQAFVPASAPFEPDHLNKQPLKTALIYLAHLKTLDEKLGVGKQGRIKLLTLWSNLPITGKTPLYAQLFLSRAVLKSDPVFDDPRGRYLSGALLKLKDHVFAVQGALGLSTGEIEHVLQDAGQSLATADLSLPNLSLLYRYRLLARALKLSVRELVALKGLSGLDPFAPLLPGPLADTAPGVMPAKKAVELDHPFSQTLRFVEIAQQAKDSGLKIEDLDYLLRHRIDDTRKNRPNPDATLALLKTLADGIRAIRLEHAVPDDPSAMSDDVLRQKLGLVLAPDVVGRFVGMLSGTAEFTATRSGVESQDKLQSDTFSADERIREISYKEVPNKEQKLTFRSVLFELQKTELQAAFDSALTSVQRLAFAELLGGVMAQPREFFDNELKKQRLRLDGEAGFLEEGDFSSLFLPLPPLKRILPTDTEQEITDKLLANEVIQGENLAALQRRRNRIAQAFFPVLQQRLIRQFIIQTMTAYTGADAVLVAGLLTDKRLLGYPEPLLEAFTATEGPGTGAGFFDEAGTLLNPANSARFEGYLEVPSSGAYRFHVVLEKKDARAELRFTHLPNSVFLAGTAAADSTVLGDQPAEFLELKVGVPYRFSLDLAQLNGGTARLLVQGETMPRAGVSQLRLYPLDAFERGERATVLLTKVLQLTQGLGLKEREIRYLLTHGTAFDGVSLSQLPTRSGDDTPARTTALFGTFLRWAAYARLKRELAGGREDLIEIFEANEGTGADTLDTKVYPLIARLTRRDVATVKAAADALIAASSERGFDSERPVDRLWQALQVIERFGVSPATLLEWTRVAGSNAPLEPRFEMARDVKESIKARLEPQAWQRVAQPVFDRLRQRQRDALSAHVMHQQHFASREQLYEHFLIDPGMEPVVQTSRIRLAIGSLQLFIQRSLLNMEPKVHPSVINSKHWEWMKRYRVWEASRKIFLFPENWLEPEFRDDKTHLFAELEGTLLQGDVSSDLAEDAFLNYLKKLDELARLEIVAMHMENAEPAATTLHVIGRTYSKPRKHFYRRYARQMWTPWEPVSADVEGDHLVPVVWRDRLYLFWVTFIDKPIRTPQFGSSTGNQTLAQANLSNVANDVSAAGQQKQIDVQLHWTEYLAGEWTTPESGDFVPVTAMTVVPPHWERQRVGDTRPSTIDGFIWVEAAEQPGLLSVPLNFNVRSVFIHVSKEPYEDGEERGVHIHLRGGGVNQAFYMAGRNAAPETAICGPKPANPLSSASRAIANHYGGSGALTVEFRRHIATEDGQQPVDIVQLSNILQRCDAYTLLPCDSAMTPVAAADAADDPAVAAAIERGLPEIDALMRPVFFQDNAHTLFVEPSVTERTLEEWQDWVTPPPQPEPGWSHPQWWSDLAVVAEIPRNEPAPDPADPRGGFGVDTRSLINPNPRFDWLANPGTALEFDGVLIGRAGRLGLEILSAGKDTNGGAPVNVHPASGLALGSTLVVASGTGALERNGLTGTAGGLNVVGGGGFNAGLARNFDESIRAGFGADSRAAVRPER